MAFPGVDRVIKFGALQIPWNSTQFRGTAPVSENGAFRVPWNSMAFHGTLVSTKLAHFKFHGIPWNCSCHRNWHTPTARVMEIGALQVHWNTLELHRTAHVMEINAPQVSWNSKEFHGTAHVIEIVDFQFATYNMHFGQYSLRIKKIIQNFSRVPRNFLNRIWTTSVVPWNSMELRQQNLKLHGIPWKSFQIQSSIEFHGTFSILRGVPWNSMELLISPKKVPFVFHGIRWNFKRIIFLNIFVGIWLMIICYLAIFSQKRYTFRWFQYRNSYFEHPSVSENGTRSVKMACYS